LLARIEPTVGFRYSALMIRAGHGDKVLHLVRDGAEASLCGLPRSALGPGSDATELVCEDCIEWLPKRMDASIKLRKAQRT
jgi:hypothetical protein